MTTQQTFLKTHIVQQIKHQWQIKSLDLLFIVIQEIGSDLSLMKISYILTKRTTKTEKFEKYLKMYTQNFRTIHYKLAASVKIIHSILNCKLVRPVSNLYLPKEQKQAKTANSGEKIDQEKCGRHLKMNHSLTTSIFSIYFSFAMGFFFFINITSTNPQIWTNTLEPRNSW